MAVFGSRGYHNGSLIEIATQAGMTHAGVLHHFGSKEQLLIALLEYRDDADVANLEGHHAPGGPAFLDHLVLTARENTARPGIIQAYAVLSGESVTEGHPAQQFFRGRLAGLRTMLAAALEEAADGAPADEIARAAAAIIATMDGLQMQWLLEPKAVQMPETVELVIESLLARLRDDGGRPQ
jgi:AcrR family transcriptional regulator